MQIGKVTPQKLGNFPEIDLFVLFSCPRAQLLDNREFYKPIITPFELECGLSNSWTGECLLDYKDLLTRPEPEEIEEGDRQTAIERFGERGFQGLEVLDTHAVAAEPGLGGTASHYISEPN
mmetsp:Transcript_19150/g.34951  ORF Transcript_19150/g.34951 Transcript_19150/m.34951 type:complete len:121 (-) Transcript_19150:1255-1617(-)